MSANAVTPSSWRMVTPQDGGDAFWVNDVSGETSFEPPRIVAVPTQKVIIIDSFHSCHTLILDPYIRFPSLLTWLTLLF